MCVLKQKPFRQRPFYDSSEHSGEIFGSSQDPQSSLRHDHDDGRKSKMMIPLRSGEGSPFLGSKCKKSPAAEADRGRIRWVLSLESLGDLPRELGLGRRVRVRVQGAVQLLGRVCQFLLEYPQHLLFFCLSFQKIFSTCK